MNHVTQRIQAFLDGELAPDEARLVREHLQACEACRSEVATHRRLHARLMGAGQTPVLAPIWPELSVRLPRYRRQAWPWPYRGLAVAAAAAGILVGWRLGAPVPAPTAEALMVAGEVGYLENSLPSLDHLWLQVEDANGDDGS